MGSHPPPFILYVHMTDVDGLIAGFKQIVGQHCGCGAEGNQKQGFFFYFAGLLLDVFQAFECISGRTKNTPDAPGIIEKIVAHSEPAFLSFDEDDVPVIPNALHVVKPSGGIFFAGKIHIRTGDECIIIFSSRYQQTVPPRTVQIKMSSPEPATFAIVAIQIAECVGDADNMSFFVTLQHFGQSFSQ